MAEQIVSQVPARRGGGLLHVQAATGFADLVATVVGQDAYGPMAAARDLAHGKGSEDSVLDAVATLGKQRSPGGGRIPLAELELVVVEIAAVDGAVDLYSLSMEPDGQPRKDGFYQAAQSSEVHGVVCQPL